MTLQQLRYIVAVVKNGLNITQAAEHLFTSQPAVSKQIRQLEDELGFEIFTRRGKSLDGVTKAGQCVVKRAERIVGEAENIKQMSLDLREEADGTLSIGTTQTQATYVLPRIISAFREKFPKVSLDLQQGTSEQLTELLASDQVDFVIASDGKALFNDAVRLPCFHWHRILIVPEGHPLATSPCPTLKQLSKYPLASYTLRASGRSSLLKAFEKEGLKADLAFTARDSDVIKTYVRGGAGVGVIAAMAWQDDPGLVALSAKNLFPRCLTWIGYRKGRYLRRYMKEFVYLFAPHIDHLLLEQADLAANGEVVESLFEQFNLPVHDVRQECAAAP